MERLDTRVRYIPSMEQYLEQYGRHFNKKLFESAVKSMRDRNGNEIPMLDKDRVNTFLKANGVNLKNDIGHDAAWVLHMAKADYWGSTVTDDSHLALFVRDFIDDPDGYPTKAFDHYVADSIGKGEPIFWDEML